MMEPMLPCDEVMDRLWEYLDGELDPETAGQVEKHLEVCQRCFPQYDFRRAFKELLSHSAEGSVPPALQRRVFEALLEEDRAAGVGGGKEGGSLWARIRRRFGH